MSDRPYRSTPRPARTLATLLTLALACTGVSAQRATGPWTEMDYGPFLSAAIEVAPGNVACRGIALPLGGDRAVLFDTATLRMACGWRGEFLDLRGIVYEGAHGEWPRIAGEPDWVVTPSPGVSIDGRFRDPRPVPFGPLPGWLGAWEGLALTEAGPLLRYRVDETRVREVPAGHEHDGAFAYLRQLAFTGGEHPISIRLALHGHDRARWPEEGRLLLLEAGERSLAVGVAGPDAGAIELRLTGDNVIARLTPGPGTRRATIVLAPVGPDAGDDRLRGLLASVPPTPDDPAPQAPLWPERFEMRGTLGVDAGGEAQGLTLSRESGGSVYPLEGPPGSSVAVRTLADGTLSSGGDGVAVLVFSSDRSAGTLPEPAGRWDADGAAVGGPLETRGVAPVDGVRGRAMGFDGAGVAEWPGSPIEFLESDLTVSAWVRTDHDGVIFAQSAREGPWTPDGKALFVRDGRLCFDVGWVGVVTGKRRIADGRWHHVALVWEHGPALVGLFVDGEPDAAGTLRPGSPTPGFVTRLGFSAPNFPASPRLEGALDGVRIDRRALGPDELLGVAAEGGEPIVVAWGARGARGPGWSIDPPGVRLSGLAPGERVDLLSWRGPVSRLAEFGEALGRASAAPFEIDRVAWPADNPYRSWMRFGDFDFLEGGRAAAITTWSGDVWRVEGLDADLSGLRWRRIAAGISQPLGLLTRSGPGGEEILVAGRDQITRLVDLNGDGETDLYESFNDDTMNSEHFHEPVSGLQADGAGNLYYAKGARHALPAVHPRHGTIVRVAPDGSRSEIVASGFRAPNGVWVDGDGTAWCSDQQGHWTPANRINRVVPGGFYGNNWSGTGAPRDDPDPPLCWIHPFIDRSPSAQVRVPEGLWGDLSGALLGMSYGTGEVYRILEDEVGGVHQGGIVPLLIEIPTGVMRGRFHPTDGSLYLCGLFGWSSNKTEPGGFYRVRRSGELYLMPLHVRAVRDGLVMRFNAPLDPGTGASDFAIEAWNYRRSAQYGSPDLDLDSGEVGRTAIAIEGAQLSADGRSVWLEIPGMRTAHQMHVAYRLRSIAGAGADSFAHLTVHALAEESGRYAVR